MEFPAGKASRSVLCLPQRHRRWCRHVQPRRFRLHHPVVAVQGEETNVGLLNSKRSIKGRRRMEPHLCRSIKELSERTGGIPPIPRVIRTVEPARNDSLHRFHLFQPTLSNLQTQPPQRRIAPHITAISGEVGAA